MRLSRPDSEWHLDKRVNVGIMVGLLAQAIFFGAAWGSLRNTVASHSAQILALQTVDAQRSADLLARERLTSAAASELRERMVRLEERQAQTVQVLEEIRALLRRQDEL